MTTRLSVGRRRCDASCYLAVGDACRCVCGGAHHGTGAPPAAGGAPTRTATRPLAIPLPFGSAAPSPIVARPVAIPRPAAPVRQPALAMARSRVALATAVALFGHPARSTAAAPPTAPPSEGSGAGPAVGVGSGAGLTAEQAQEIDPLLARHPDWCWSAEDERRLRLELYRALLPMVGQSRLVAVTDAILRAAARGAWPEGGA